ncbi:MAG: lytic transglycosylase domain-containing protein [Ignavibacteria bacterium]|nr:lytic transglycosylase domain-containing protein [Ignavibacteria bacterium]
MILTSCSDAARGASNQNNVIYTDTLPISRWQLPDSLSFCGESVPLADPEVRERAEREFYINLQTPGQIVLYLKRSARWFPMFERIIREEKMPDDMKYVSIAESALYMSKSPKDAVGLWQIIPNTARAMGLIVNEMVDERRHPEKSTRAAMRYLRQGYTATGSWTNAAAGYNMGHENFAENQRYQGVKDFYDLFLNEETSRYVLRIAIIKHIVEHAHEYGIVIPQDERYNPAPVKAIAQTEAVENLAQWASEHRTTYKDVKINNPWILGRSLPEGTWLLAVSQ